MLDFNKERLRQLMATAILELWKKETGSLSPVILEGTICFTTINGRTTVIQVTDRSAAVSLPYCAEGASRLGRRSGATSDSGGGGQGQSGAAALYCGPNVDTHSVSTAAAMAAYLDDLSPASLVSPPADGPHACVGTGSAGGMSVGGGDSRPCSRAGSLQAGRGASSSSTSSNAEPGTATVATEHSNSQTMCPDHSNNVNTRNSSINDSGINCSMLEQSAANASIRKPIERRRMSQDSSDLDIHSDKESDDEYIDIASDSKERRELRHYSPVNCHNISGSVGSGYNATSHCQPRSTQDNHTGSDSSRSGSQRDEEEEGDEQEEHCGMDTTEEFSLNVSGRGGPLMSTPKNSRGYPDRLRVLDTESPALDLSRRDPDELALSPPQNYTAQVRDVIRQRLLAQKFTMNQLKIEQDSSKDLLLGPCTTRAPASPPTPEVRVGASEERGPPLSSSESLPSTPASVFPMPPLLSPEQASRLMFPFPPFTAQHRSMLYAAEHFQSLMQRSMAGLLPPQSPQPLNADRPASEPSTPEARAHSPAPSDRLSSSFDGRQTPQSGASSNGEQQKVYSCDYCHKTFLFKSKYHEHLPVHTNARPFQCRLCSRTYKYKYDLRVHLRTHLGIPTKSTLCPFCNAKFDTNKLLRHHIKDIHRDHHKVLSDEQLQMFDAV